jgi:pimeloyl-ACP methyl ester carboxylesterase
VSVRTVVAADTSFLLREDGSGPGVPVLLLHGVPETSSSWRQLAPRLAEGRRVLAPDLPGLGGSSYGGPFDVPSLVAQLAALVEAESGGHPVDVVGHDWGGSLALGLAGARPDLVRRLVVANAPYRTVPLHRALHIPLFALPVAPELLFRLGGRRVVRLMLGLGWRSSTPLDPETQAEYEAAYSHPETVRAMLGYYRAATRPRLAALVLRRQWPAGSPRVRADRMLVLWGARDPVLPVSTGESVVRDLGPECVMVTVPGAGHFVVEEAPDVVADVLVDFLAEVPTAGEPSAAPPEGPEQPRVAEQDPPAGPAGQVRTVGGVPVGATPQEKDDDAPAEQPAAKKAAAKKAPAKKAAAKKAPAKKAAPKKAPVKKAATKKAPPSSGTG